MEHKKEGFGENLAQQEQPASLQQQHLDANLYYRAFSGGSQRAASVEDALLWSRLSRLAVPSNLPVHFAASVREALQAHPQLKAIKRVCLARRLGLANQLEVISSDGDVKQNTMLPGYRCFVAPDGSLFKLLPGSVRIFTSAHKLVEGYRSEGKPPQRSIGRIAAMNLASGLCVGIFIGKQLAGLLFLNAEDDFLAQLPVDYLPLISDLAVHAHRHFLGSGPDSLYSIVWQGGEKRLASSPYDATSLSADLNWVLRRMNGPAASIDVIHEGLTQLPSLLVHGHVAYILARLLTLVASTRMTVAATIVGEFLQITCGFDTPLPAASSPHLTVICQEAVHLGYQPSLLSTSSIQLATAVDRLGIDTSVFYSVEAAA